MQERDSKFISDLNTIVCNIQRYKIVLSDKTRLRFITKIKAEQCNEKSVTRYAKLERFLKFFE